MCKVREALFAICTRMLDKSKRFNALFALDGTQRNHEARLFVKFCGGLLPREKQMFSICRADADSYAQLPEPLYPAPNTYFVALNAAVLPFNLIHLNDPEKSFDMPLLLFPAELAVKLVRLQPAEVWRCSLLDHESDSNGRLRALRLAHDFGKLVDIKPVAPATRKKKDIMDPLEAAFQNLMGGRDSEKRKARCLDGQGSSSSSSAETDDSALGREELAFFYYAIGISVAHT